MKKQQQYIAVFLAVFIAITALNTNFCFALESIDYRDIVFGENERKPIAQFGVSVNNPSGPYTYSIEEDSINYDNHPKVTAYVGDTLYIKDMSYSRMGRSITGNSYDFQYYGLGYTYKAYTTKENVEKPIALNQPGTLTVFLMVKDKDNIVQGWHNWSQNGTRRVLGDHMAISEQKVWWYFTAITVEVKVPESTAEFEIHHQGTNVTDNYNNPIMVDNFPYNVELVDKSTTPAGTTITSWEWEGNTGSSWVPLSTQKNPSDSISAGWKAYRLRVTNNKGATSVWVRHDVYAQKKSDPPPETPPGSWEIIAKLWADPYPAKVPIKLNEYNNNLPVQIKMDLDATGSSASEEIKDYLFYYRVGKGPWIEFDWTPNKKITVDVLVRKSDENAEKKIVIDARVGVRDTKGNIRYGHDDARVEFDIQTVPPETELQLPAIFYPKEVTNFTAYKNIIKWSYASEDEIPYKESIVSLYRLNGAAWIPVFENQKQIPRELEITGNAEEIYRIVVKVVDELGKESSEVWDIFRIETARPIIDVTLDLNRVESNILGINVDNLTDPEIEALYPTTYTSWMIVDAKEKTLESGVGKLPEEVEMDERYKGTVNTAIQRAVNTLGNGAMDKEHYNSNSLLEFEIVPNRLFETELARIIDQSRSLINRTWGIKKNTEVTYGPFEYPPGGEFTKDAGKYDVRSEGRGIYVTTGRIYQYSNLMDQLYNEPLEPTDTEVKDNYGDGYVLAKYTARWDGKVEIGAFTYKGTAYSYRRPRSIMIIRDADFSRIRSVEFLPAEPGAIFDVEGHTKQYKEVKLDGSRSVDITDPELQAKYPIQFDHESTQFVVEPLDKLEGSPVYSMNQDIKGLGREIIDGKVVFRGRKNQSLRFDTAGVFRITYYTWNGLKLSKPFVREIVVEPELLPTVDIQVANPVVYREPNYDLKAFMHVVVYYNSPDDEIDLDKSYLTIKYDANNDGDYTNDVGQQGIIKKGEEDLPPNHIYVSNKIFQADRAIFSVGIDNPDKNMFGQYKFEFKAYEKPIIPYYDLFHEGFEIYVDTENINISKKLTLLDNAQPMINIQMSRTNKSELTIIETSVTTPITTTDIQYILDFFKAQKVQLDIKYIDITGKEFNYKNYD